MRSLVTLGGKVRKKSGSGLDADRYSFLSLDNAEPDFGVPSSDNSLLISKTAGTRSFASLGTNLEYDSDTQSIITSSTMSFGSAAALTSEVTSLSTVTQTQVASFSATTYGGGKFVIQAYDATAGDRHITELLVTHDGTTAVATEYATVHTSTNALATYEVDINAGNVRILATGASSNTTRYTILENLMVE